MSFVLASLEASLVSMRALGLVLAASAVQALSFGVPNPQKFLGHDSQEGRYLIELAPDDQRLVTEEEKWALKRVCPTSAAHGLGADSIAGWSQLHGH